MSYPRYGLNPGPWPTFGVSQQFKGFRNGISPSAEAVTQLGGFINQIVAYRRQCIFVKEEAVGATYGSDPEETTWRFRFHTGPGGTRVQMRMILEPAGTDVGDAPDPRCHWVTTPEGGSPTSQATVRHATRSATTPLNARFEVQPQIWTLEENTHYTAELVVADECRVVAAVAWIMPRTILSFSADSSISPLAIQASQSIYGSGFAQHFDLTDDMWRGMGTHHAQWTKTGTAGITISNTGSAQNLFDTSVAAWSATSPGFYTIPLWHGSYHSPNVPAVFYAFAKYTAAQGTIALVKNGGTLGTITVDNTTASWFTANVNLDGEETDAKYDLIVTPGAAGTIVVDAAGLYEYSE